MKMSSYRATRSLMYVLLSFVFLFLFTQSVFSQCAPLTAFTEDFESTTNVTTSATGNIHTSADHTWDYETTGTGGEIRFGTNGGGISSNNGSGSFLMHNENSNVSVNYAILTLNMSGYSGINLSFSLLDFGGGDDPNDRIWVRGTSTDPWVLLYNWHTAGSGGFFVGSGCLDVSATLLGAGQAAGATFGVRFGEEGDNSFDSGVGLVVDDVFITAATFMPPPAIPTVGEWGLILLGFLVTIFGVVAIRQSELQLAVSKKTISPSFSFPTGLPFDKAVFSKMLVMVLIGLAMVFTLAVSTFGYEMTSADVPGCLVAGPLLAYLLQLLAMDREI